MPLLLFSGVRSLEQMVEHRTAEVRQHASVIEKMELGIVLFHLEDPEDKLSLRIIWTNAAVEPHSGYSPEEIIGRTLVEVFPEIIDTDWGRMAIVDTKPFKLSLSHKAESSSMLSFWIPAFAGMTAYVAVFHTLSGWS